MIAEILLKTKISGPINESELDSKALIYGDTEKELFLKTPSGTVLRFEPVENNSIITTNITVSHRNVYYVDTSTSPITLTLPLLVTSPFYFTVVDYAGTWNTNNVTISRNGHKIIRLSEDFIIDDSNRSYKFNYVDSNVGFLITQY